MRASKSLLFAATLTISIGTGCGLLGDGETRDGALSQYDDVILPGEEPGAGSETPDMVCEYPPMLTSGSHALDLRDCVKIEGGQIGDDVVLDVNGETVTVTDWLNKDGEGEYVGFHVDGDVIVIVKAGTDLFEGTDGTWVHPEGTGGPQAKGISFVAFCEPPPDEPECKPLDGGDGPSGEPGSGDETPMDGGDDDGSGGSTDDGSGGSTDDGSGGSTDDGSGGKTSMCSLAPCGADNACASNQACFDGCCVAVIL